LKLALFASRACSYIIGKQEAEDRGQQVELGTGKKVPGFSVQISASMFLFPDT